MGKRTKKAVIVSALLFAAYNIIGFLVLPAVMKAVLTKKLSEALKREVTIERVRSNPYNLTFTINGFKVKTLDGAGTFISFEELFLNAEASSVIKKGPVVKEFRLVRPFLGITRNADLTYNFTDLIPQKAQPEAPKTENEDMPVFSINNIQIEDGMVDFHDAPKGKDHEVRELTVGIPFVSNLPSFVEVFVQPAFHAVVNGTSFELKGSTKPFSGSRETTLNFNLEDLDVTRYLEYSPVKMNYLLSSGLISLDAEVSYIQFEDRGPSVTLNGTIAFKDIRLDDIKGKPMVDLPLFSIGIGSAELFTRKVHLSEVLLKSPSINLVRAENGALNLLALVPERGMKGQKKAGRGAKGDFTLDIDTARVERAGVSFSDLTTSTPFKRELKPVDITVSGFGTGRGKRASVLLSFRNKAGEAIKADGSISINPVSADLKLDVKQLNVSPVQAYLDKMLRITITKGFASTSGSFSLRPGGGGMTATYRGRANITRFASINKVDAEDFLKWQSLSFTGMDVGYNPVRASIKGVALTDFYSRIIINPDGRLNVQEIIVRDEKDEAEKPEAGAKAVEKDVPVERKTETAEEKKGERDIKIDTVTLQGGRVNFTDMHIKPEFSVDLLEVGGRVSGLSSGRLADVNLIGRLDKYAPLEIIGNVDPLREDLYVDLRLAFKDFELSSLTPYSGKYIGYKIEKGKLVLDLEYLIEERMLKSENKILIDQITFGEAVESEDATSLPVGFALNLLKNRRGEIRLNFPISGSIDDPNFRVGGIILKMFLNMVIKAVSSPFALLGALVGGGEELSYVEFDHGGSVISEGNARKLESLVAALFDRPNLKLEIEGYVDEDKDREALRQLMFTRSIKAEKLRVIVRKGQEAVPIDEVEVDPEEYDRYLWRAYKRADFPKPKTIVGFTKKIPPAEMEKLMLTHTEITDDDLRKLAERRSKEVKDFILSSGKVEAERVFVVWPKTLSPEVREGDKKSRVAFRLK